LRSYFVTATHKNWVAVDLSHGVARAGNNWGAQDVALSGIPSIFKEVHRLAIVLGGHRAQPLNHGKSGECWINFIDQVPHQGSHRSVGSGGNHD
jgi:hypothetical protein